MHQNEAQQAVTQMPQITSPNPLHLTAVCQLTEDRIDEVANPSQDTAKVRCRFRRVRFAEGSLQENAFDLQAYLRTIGRSRQVKK